MNENSNLNNFLDKMRALRTFVNSVEPILMGKIESNLRENKRSFQPFFKMLKIDPETNAITIDEEQKKLFEEKYGMKWTDNGNKKTLELKPGALTDDFTRAIEHFKLTHDQIEMLYQNSLMNLITYFETVISGLIKEHLTRQGDFKNKSLTFEQISQLGNLDEAKEFLLEKEVHDLMYKGFDVWILYIKKNLKLSMGYLDPVKDQLIEIFQRRNLFTHNNGVANNIYISRIAPQYAKNTTVGSKIVISKTYLEESINLIENMGNLILLENWKKKEPKNEKRAFYIGELLDEHFKCERWELVKSYSRFLMGDKGLPQSSQLVGQVNYWQSFKWLNQFNEVKEDVMNADFSANRGDFQLCLLALQDKEKEFFSLLNKSYPSYISLEKLKNWPIFKEMRKIERIKTFIKNAEHKEERKTKSIKEQTEEAIKQFEKLDKEVDEVINKNKEKDQDTQSS